MHYRSFNELPIWQTAMELTKRIYDATAIKAWSRDYALRDQVRRAVISISSNIVEGFEKNITNEFIRYLRIAKGSTGEVRNQLHIAFNVNYLTKEEFEVLNDQFARLGSDIGGLIRYLEGYRQAKKIKRLSR